MTDIEHAKKYAEDSISLATSMMNPHAESIAEYACLYGLTYKNDEIDKLKEENEQLKKQQFSLRNERNAFLAQNEQYEKDLIDFNEKLTEAKYIIRNLLQVTYGEGWDYSLDWKVKAEQFLKEIEND